MIPDSYERHLAQLAKDPEHQKLCEENINRLLKHARYLERQEHIEHLRQKFGMPPRRSA